MGIKDSYGVVHGGLKPAQAWGCPCSMKCIFKDITFPPPFLYLCLHKRTGFGNQQTDTNVLSHYRRDFPPPPPLSLCSGGAWIAMELTMR
jgi:hypothetical protein